MNQLKKVYYHLTAYVPRPIPKTSEAYEAMKKVMVEAYGVVDEPKSWATIAGHFTSTPPHSLRRAWGSVANAAKRLDINKIAQDDKNVAYQALQEKLDQALKAQAQKEEDEKNALKETKEVEQEANDCKDTEKGSKASGSKTNTPESA